MTTNPTIDGVPRADLEAAIKADASRGATASELVAGWGAMERLRALLDADECCHEFVPFQANCTKCGLPYKPAAQPQGETVAWIDWSGGDCPVDADAVVEYAMACNPQQVCGPEAACRLDWRHDQRPTKRKPNIVKYRAIAKPPAPVAVVLPVDPERERLMEIVQQYPNVDPLEYDAAVRTLRK